MSNYGRIETADSIYGINKAIIAEIFTISRSAVTQTCQRRSVDQDLETRIMWLLKGFSHNIHAVGKNAQDNSVLLLRRLKVIIARREQVAAAKSGRPPLLIKFSTIKRLIRSLLATIWQPVAEVASVEHRRINIKGKHTIFINDPPQRMISQAGEGLVFARDGYYVLTDHIIEKFERITVETTDKYFKLLVESGIAKDYNF